MIDFNRMVSEVMQPRPDDSKRAAQFLKREQTARRYALGRNEEARAVAREIGLDGIVDDFAKDAGPWEGIPIIASDDLPLDAMVVNCSTSIAPVSAQRRLLSLPIAGVVSYHQLMVHEPDRFPLPGFVSDTRSDLSRNLERWKWLSGRLADSASRGVLDDLLRFRVSADPTWMEGYSVRLSEQYFEPFLKFGEAPVFVDAGGYDGDTTQEFCERYPDYSRVLLFEPSVANLTRAKARLGGRSRIDFYDIGLSDARGELFFDGAQGSASHIGTDTGDRIEVDTLDDRVDARVSYLKMDLEGWELNALRGCRRHIVEAAPTLAIAVYHSASDFWRLPEFVLSMRDEYRIYLRHYTEGWSETVAYFVP